MSENAFVFVIETVCKGNSMWWLCNDAKPERTPTATALPPKAAPVSPSTCALASAPAATTQQKPAATTKRDPLIDTLTPQQNKANRILAQVQCGHQNEIERLTGDVVSLERSLRDYAGRLRASQTQLEVSESMLLAAQQRVERLESERTEKNLEIDRLRAELRLQQESNSELQNRMTEQAESEDDHWMKLQHIVAELTTALEQQDAEHKDQTRRDREVAIKRRDRDNAALKQSKQISELWQRSAFRFRGEAERFRSKLHGCEQELHASAQCIVGLESEAVWKERQIESLSRRQQEIQHAELIANQRAEYWQSETQHSQTARRALSEQASRQQSVAESTIQELTNELQQTKQRDSMQQLRIDRLRSNQSQQEQLRKQTQRSAIITRRCREKELSRLQFSNRISANTIESFKRRSRSQQDEIVLLKDAVTAAQTQQASAWTIAQQAVTRLQTQERLLDRVTKTRERLVQMQSHQFQTLQQRIDCLIGQIDNAQMSFGIETESLQRLISERDGLIDQLVTEQDVLARNNDLLESTHQQLLHESAKARAQLASGRAKGVVLIDEYERRLQRATRTIDALRRRIDPGSSSRAA